jgi:hypothetical protein
LIPGISIGMKEPGWVGMNIVLFEGKEDEGGGEVELFIVKGRFLFKEIR